MSRTLKINGKKAKFGTITKGSITLPDGVAYSWDNTVYKLNLNYTTYQGVTIVGEKVTASDYSQVTYDGTTYNSTTSVTIEKGKEYSLLAKEDTKGTSDSSTIAFACIQKCGDVSTTTSYVTNTSGNSSAEVTLAATASEYSNGDLNVLGLMYEDDDNGYLYHEGYIYAAVNNYIPVVCINGVEDSYHAQIFDDSGNSLGKVSTLKNSTIAVKKGNKIQIKFKYLSASWTFYVYLNGTELHKETTTNLEYDFTVPTDAKFVFVNFNTDKKYVYITTK